MATDWLEKAYDEHAIMMTNIGGSGWDHLRSYPRFKELLRKMNLPVDEKE